MLEQPLREESTTVKSMHCLECGSATHPKLRHPSSMRTEATLWGVALVVGLSVGAWQAVTSSAGAGVAGMSQLSVVATPAEAPEVQQIDHVPPRNVVVTVGSWLLDRFASFVRVAWWALPIPLFFSLWRQFARRPACARCGSRRLIEADVLLPGG